MALPYLNKDCGTYEQTCHALFDLFLHYEWKIRIHTHKRPVARFEYIHSRYNAHDVREIHDQEWGHAQHDAIGAFLYMVGEGTRYGRKVIRNDKDLEILQLLVNYLNCCQFWNDPDNGMWEETPEVHASSIGACIAGLWSLRRVVQIPPDALYHGFSALYSLRTRESITKEIDLAQLSLIYPYRMVNQHDARELINLVEKKLLRERGVIRYYGDSYYSTLDATHTRNNPPEFYAGTEAEWCFGLPWLAICHMMIGNRNKAARYIEHTEEVMIAPGELPELYYADSAEYNVNTPLGWGSAMYILAKEMYEEGATHGH